MLSRLAFAQENHADRRHEDENADDLKWQIVTSKKQQPDVADIIECRSCQWGKRLLRRF
jgi:hypothetical protein